MKLLSTTGLILLSLAAPVFAEGSAAPALSGASGSLAPATVLPAGPFAVGAATNFAFLAPIVGGVLGVGLIAGGGGGGANSTGSTGSTD